jgi:hypothetical protein
MARTKQNNYSRALSTTNTKDIESDIPKDKRKHSGEGEINSNVSNLSNNKITTPRKKLRGDNE